MRTKASDQPASIADRRRRRRSYVVALFVVAASLAVLPTARAADDPTWPAPDWYARQAADAALPFERLIDHETHPVWLEYEAGLLAAEAAEGRVGMPYPEGDLDPYRLDWDGNRGRQWSFDFANRYGARLAGDVYAPPAGFVDPNTGRSAPGPYPVVFVTQAYGDTAYGEHYQWLAHGLAEAGYVAVTFDTQGQGQSELEPDEKYCGDEGWWREPQEAGLREYGACAGQSPDTETSEYSTRHLAADGVSTVALFGLGDGDDADLHENYLRVAAAPVFGLIDTIDHVLEAEGDEDWRAMIDSSRVGVVGHSLGAFAAMVVGSLDPRVDAAVSYDGYGLMPLSDRPASDAATAGVTSALRGEPSSESTVTPRAPTLFVGTEHADVQPSLHGPPADDLAPSRNAEQFMDAGVDTMAVYLRGSTHQDFVFGFWLPGQSRHGERVSFHYTLAWFDRYVRALGPNPQSIDRAQQEAEAAGGADAHSWRALRSDALRRLALRTFDASSDRSSIGLGIWNPDIEQNESYRIAGMCVADKLSYLYRSFAAVDGFASEDLRARGCD